MAVVGANTRQTCSLVAEALGCSWKENLDLVHPECSEFLTPLSWQWAVWLG